nr:G-protein coupled receptor; transcript variant X5; misc_RNA [Biomphalaria glabrata]
MKFKGHNRMASMVTLILFLLVVHNVEMWADYYEYPTPAPAVDPNWTWPGCFDADLAFAYCRHDCNFHYFNFSILCYDQIPECYLVHGWYVESGCDRYSDNISWNPSYCDDSYFNTFDSYCVHGA